jgi:mediator of replication checkpoint protein 1
MSSSSTPRSTRSASPAGDSPNIITPGQKIKAMLAQFDSDSEDETQITKSTNAVSKLNLGRHTVPTAETHENDPSDDLEASDSADEVIRPKGRMAARLQGNITPAESKDENSAFARVSKAIRLERTQAEKPRQTEPEPEPTPNDESSDDDLPTAGRRRKNVASSSPKYNDRASQTPPPARADSPLFVSSPGEPNDDADTENEDADHSDAEKPKGNARFMALVTQKRKEREEREKEETEKRAARKAQNEHFSSEILSGEESDAEDPRSASKLSQKARQPRKAGKKAMEEMRQETQRMSRNMQLAHQAQTKKKITKQSLFARFNFMQPDTPAEQPAANSSSAVNSQNSSDGELRTKAKDTPHTSPLAGHAETPKQTKDSEHVQGEAADVDMDADLDNLPPPADLLAPKDKAALAEEDAVQEVPTAALKHKAEGPKAKKVFRPLTQRPIRVLLSRKEVAAHQKNSDDSDSDLEVVTSPGKCRGIAAFENLPTRQLQEDPSMTKLKALAHLTSPTRRMASMNPAELSANLLWRARQQAAKERRDRIEELRAKGVVIETAEERAAIEDDMENLVDKARKEADEIRRLEKAARKKSNGDDDDEDNDYELSGSEQEADGEGADEDDEEDENDSINGDEGLVDQEADVDDDESEAAASDVEDEVPAARRKRPTRVVSDDEDEDQPQPPSTPVRAPSFVPQSAERPKFPGMGTPGDMSLGLTQAFASTLDGNGVGSPGSTIPFSLPDPGRPVPQLRKQESEILVPDSQPLPQDKDFIDGYTQSVTRVSESPAPYAFSEYSQSQLPDPTQDEGFVFSPFDPAKRFRDTPPVSTVDTVLIGQTQSPIANRKRKMLRRGRVSELPQVEEGDNEGDFEINANAFDVMKKAKAVKKHAAPQYDKNSSKAKDIIDEAAEESEDEYAGLGGNSDESDGEENAIDRQMINDNSGEVVDEKELAALNAYVQSFSTLNDTMLTCSQYPRSQPRRKGRRQAHERHHNRSPPPPQKRRRRLRSRRLRRRAPSPSPPEATRICQDASRPPGRRENRRASRKPQESSILPRRRGPRSRR